MPTTSSEHATLSPMTGFVYMLASQKNGTLYIGVTNSLARRIPEHYTESETITYISCRDRLVKIPFGNLYFNI